MSDAGEAKRTVDAVAPMRFLFISGTIGGGSGRSQRELANALVSRGHEVRFIVDLKKPARFQRWCHGKLSNASVRWHDNVVGDVATFMRDRVPSLRRQFEKEGLQHDGTALPQNAMREVMKAFTPDVVVVSSISRWVWRQVHQLCAERDIFSVLYLREEDLLGNVVPGSIPDALVANADSFVTAMQKRGFTCHFVPSLVDTGVTRTTSTRRAALAVNPAQLKGGDIVLQIAARLPEIPFVLQESWPLTPEERSQIDARVRSLPNVEFREMRPPGPELYGDARVLLVPYRVNSRPRVILEAQDNGLPIIAADVSALVTAVGSGGIIVPLDDIDAWVEAVRLMWSDEDAYQRLAAAARQHSQRGEVDPQKIVESFEHIVRGPTTNFCRASEFR